MSGIRLAIDAVGAKHSGAATVLLATLEAARAASWIEEIIVYCSPGTRRQFSLPRDQRVREVDMSVAEWGGLGRVFWHRYGLPRSIRRRGVNLLVCLSGGGEAPDGIPSATLIQQVLPFTPEVTSLARWSMRVRILAIKQQMRRSCKRSTVVVVQTPTMKQTVVREFHLPVGKVHVLEPIPTIPGIGHDEGNMPALMADVPSDRRILYVGNAMWYKNLPVLGRAMEILRQHVPDATLFATLPEGDVLLRQPSVLRIGGLSREDLAEYYRAATVLVMPSLAETVGLPMLEAAVFDTAVVAADRPYAHDVCGDAALYFDPANPVSMAAALREVLTSPDLRSTLVRRGRQVVAERRAKRPYDTFLELMRQVVVRSAA